ncbi:MAG: hypothetical protein AAB486_01705 [Patescibacteria group bacterium]
MITRLLAGSIIIPIEPDPSNARWNFGDIGQLMSILLQAVIILAGLGTFVFLILAGIQYLTSGGEKAQVEAARNKITYSIVGLTIIAGSYVLTRIIETVFGISIVSGICWPGPLANCASSPPAGGPGI